MSLVLKVRTHRARKARWEALQAYKAACDRNDDRDKGVYWRALHATTNEIIALEQRAIVWRGRVRT